MKYLVTFALLFLVLFACGSEPPGTSTECGDDVEYSHITLVPDPAFTEAERLELRRAASEWYSFSSGHVVFTFGLDDAMPVYRVESWMQIVKDEDKTTGLTLAGWFDGGAVYLIVDRVPPGWLHLLATHELGHAAGLQWPDCKGTSAQCRHSPDKDALMAPSLGGNPLGPSDLHFCRASCLCP